MKTNYTIDYSTETIMPATRIQEISRHPLHVDPERFAQLTELICTDEKCKYPQLTLRLFNHIVAGIDTENKWNASARQISRRLGAHYDTVTKCLKYLRAIDVIRVEK